VNNEKNYDQIYKNFQWSIPEFYNIGVDVCDRPARNGAHLALISIEPHGVIRRFSFNELQRITSRFANVLASDGLVSGDRVAVLLPQAPETAIAHIAAFKAGLITVCLFTLLSDEELQYRLYVTRSKAVVTDSAGSAKLCRIRDQLPHLAQIYVVGEDVPSGDQKDFAGVLAHAFEDFAPVATRATDPAVIFFTTGTEGRPKGVLHAHQSLLGALPTFELIHDGIPRAGEVYWTPSDWAWLGGLFPVLAALRYGMPVLTRRAERFDPYAAFELMAERQVRNALLSPTALKLMRSVDRKHPPIHLRTLLSGGETLGSELLDWAQDTFGAVLHETYAQTECTGIAGNNARLFPVRPGSMGRPVPGHDVRIVDDKGNEQQRGQPGIIGVRRPDPSIFIGYWDDPVATQKKFAGDYLLTGDVARQDEDGYFWYVGRGDDLITSSGYRLSPAEIENCIMKHPAVSLVGVVGVPDPICTEAIKAWIVLKPGHSPSEGLARDIQKLVRVHLAAHEYPRQIEFADSLPMTTNGKIMRRELRARG
jgi:acetyl-CoA synthetase